MNGKLANYNVWFIADLHLRHTNILRHQKNRIIGMNLKDDSDIEGHDKYIIDMWHSLVKRRDHVYVLGDFILSKSDDSMKLLHELKKYGCHIHFIVGNHDKSTKNMTNMFDSIDLIKDVTFKKDAFTFLEEDFHCIMCHYPMKSWSGKSHGSCNLYGHVHANSLWIDEGDDLCMNVGLDNPLSNYKLFSLEQVYSEYKKKLGGMKPKEYIEMVTKADKEFIR